MIHPLVKALDQSKQARSNYEAAYERFQVTRSPHDEWIMQEALEHWSTTIALKEAQA